MEKRLICNSRITNNNAPLPPSFRQRSDKTSECMSVLIRTLVRVLVRACFVSFSQNQLLEQSVKCLYRLLLVAVRSSLSPTPLPPLCPLPLPLHASLITGNIQIEFRALVECVSSRISIAFHVLVKYLRTSVCVCECVGACEYECECDSRCAVKCHGDE